MTSASPIWPALLPILPGAVYFGRRGISAPVGRPVRRVRFLGTPGTPLALSKLGFAGVDKAALHSATITSSPLERPSASPAAAAFGGRVRLSRSEAPFWQIEFAGAVPLRAVRFRTPSGADRRHAFDLVVEVDGSDGEMAWRLDLGSAKHLAPRVRRFAADLAKLDKALGKRSGELPALAQARTAIALCGAELVGAAQAELRQEAGLCVPAERLRLSLVEAIVGAAALLEDGRLAEFLALAETPLAWLLHRDRDLAREEAATALQAVAMVFTARVLGRKMIPARELREWQFALNDPAQNSSVEEQINALYARAGGHADLLPILFRKHGLSGSLLRRHADAYAAAVAELADHLEAVGYPLALCYGTLLGAVRDHSFIAHDDDIDTLVMLKHPAMGMPAELQQLRAALQARGVATVPRFNGAILQATLKPAGITLDIFAGERQPEGSVRMLMERMEMRAVPGELVLPFVPIAFLGRSFLAPAQPEAFLAERYGQTWRTPTRWVSRNRTLAIAPQQAEAVS